VYVCEYILICRAEEVGMRMQEQTTHTRRHTHTYTHIHTNLDTLAIGVIVDVVTCVYHMHE
jgi:hypothetical protein